MADHYCEFSQILPDVLPHEEAWLRSQLQDVYVQDGQIYDDEPDGDYERAVRFLAEAKDGDPLYEIMDLVDKESCGFGWELRDDHLWVNHEGGDDTGRLCYFMSKFLRINRPTAHWGFTWAAWCSKPRIGEQDGGGVVVTATGFVEQTGSGLLWQYKQLDRFLCEKPPSPSQLKSMIRDGVLTAIIAVDFEELLQLTKLELWQLAKATIFGDQYDVSVTDMGFNIFHHDGNTLYLKVIAKVE